MDKQPDPAAFRAHATIAYRCITVALIAFVVAAGWAGWHYWHWVGLTVGTLVAAIIGGALWFGVTLIWAMTQDGG